MDPEYDPSHKTSSITSTTSTNSWDTVPSLTASSICDIDDSPSLHDTNTFEDYAFTGGDQLGLTVPYDEDFPTSHDKDDNNQRSFVHFLDHFFIDGEAAEKASPFSATTSDEGRPIFLHQSHEITIPHSSSKENNNETISLALSSNKPSLSDYLEPKIEQTDDIDNKGDATTCTKDDNDEDNQEQEQQQKASRDLLTEDEKRANHIASEQKRRNTIRTGFKEMTEIIPTLKNFNNSKSTVLFKAVDYIRHLEKRNRGLRDKLNSLQVRLEVEGRMGGLIRGSQHLLRRHSHYYNEHQHKRSRSNSLQHQQQHQQQQQLSPEALAALLAHKNQQKQLEALQEQLRYQQELLAKHNITVDSSRINHQHLSINEQSSPLSPLYYSISIPTDHRSLSTASSISASTSSSSLSSSSSSPSSSSSSSQRRSSVYSHHPHNTYSKQRNQHHRSSAPALVMPNMIDDRWHSPSTASPLGTASFTIPADDDFNHRPMAPSSPIV